MSKVLSKIKRRGNTRLITQFIYVLHQYDMRTKDVLFVATGMGSLSWLDFCKVARHDIFNGGYGCMEVVVDLMIFTTKGYFYRKEICDGMEKWDFHAFDYPISGDKLDTTKVKTFVGGCWSRLGSVLCNQ